MSKIFRITITSLIIISIFTTGRVFAATPTVGTISPSSGSTQPDVAKTFTCTYSDADGWANLKDADLLISTSSTTLANAIYLHYDQNTNKLYLRNDANTSWLGGYSPGSSYTVENSQVKLNCATTTASGSSNTLTIKWNITFKSAYSGKQYNTYLYVKDDTGGYVNWTKKGTYTVNRSPQVGTITPSSGMSGPGQANNFTTTCSDPDGWQNIQYVYFLMNTSTSGSNCLYTYYNQNTNKLYLRNDGNTSWLGGYIPGSANIIQNSYASLDCSKATISGSVTTLTVNWSVTLKSTFMGTKNTYLYVKDDLSAYQGWVQKGNWTIQTDTTPPTGTININNGDLYTNSVPVTLNLTATDSGSGMGTGAQMQFSNDSSTWSTPEEYATTKSWTLLLGDGQKRVYVKFKDVAGNWSTAYSDTIILDTMAPTLTIEPVNSPTNQNVILSYTVSDSFTSTAEIVITGDESPYTNEGNYTATLSAQDKAGNTATKQISFTIDKTPPVIIINSPTNEAVFETPDIILSGTIDGESFSENITLQNEGVNIINKTATDLAGNTGFASVTVYLYSGVPIGPEGGEVSSADGKVRVTIPPGALSEPTRIKILTVNQESLQDATPSGRTLLSVVECRPYGLVFNKPVQISYTLDQAEIPGTPVELGFYDAGQDKIVPTGQTSIVSVDGYTVSFSIMHFSTYAVLKDLVSQGAPIGSEVKIPLPDMFTGAFSYSIPITIPPGRKGVQPALALNYRSSNPNSWVGLGFSLNPGYIVRSTRLGPPTYIDEQDTFYFVTDAGATELTSLIDNLYQAKIESSFAKFFKEADDSWRVVGKDGSILRFGEVADSKETSLQGTFSWYLTKAVDTNGNYIEYTYTKDQGKAYLSRIEYTGNEIGISPTNTIEFFLEPREDIVSSYISGSKIAIAKRLKEIEVKLNYDLVWRHTLEYTYSPDTNRSLLKSITQYSSDNKSFPTLKFNYQRAK